MATSLRRFHKVRKIIDLKPNSSILKIGPATGTFLHIAQSAGHIVRGCDVSDQFASYARENYNVEIDVGRFEQQNYPENYFDIVVLFNVIENVPNLDEFMLAIARTMKTEGYFIFNHVRMSNNIMEKIQGGKYFMYRPPICYMFALQSLRKLLDKYNMFEIDFTLDIRYMTLEKVFSLFGWKLMIKLTRIFKISRFNFPLYAYPSRITIAQIKK